MSLTDETLVAAVAAGDAEAASRLVRRYQARVFGLALTILGDRAAAEDVAQECFLRVWRHAGGFDAGRGTVEAWLLTIARNLAIDVVRTRRSTPVDPADAARLLGAIGEPSSSAAQATVETDALRTALGRLPDEQRRAVLFATFGGWTAADIARHEGVALGTAKSRVRLALARLRTAMEVDE